MLSPVTHGQFEKLMAKYEGATLQELPSGAALVTIPNFRLPQGWSADSTTVRFIVPVGYPGPCPDCFWATAGLRLSDGRMPQNAADPNPIPETAIQDLWFSWHIVDGPRHWNPNRDDLLTFVSLVTRRFELPQ